jgi:hypothetical protein
MLTLSNSTNFQWPVKYRRPSQTKPGEYDQLDFVGVFASLNEQRFTELVKNGREGLVEDDKFLDDVFLGWSGIKDEHGNDFTHSPVNRRILFSELGMKKAIIDAFFEATNGVFGAVRKN